MLKKIVISLALALSIITFSEFDTERFLYELKQNLAGDTVQKNNAADVLYEGNRSVSIGMSYDDVLSAFGDPVDTQVSEYGFVWNIFHENFKNYMQIGIQNERVVAIYTNSPRFSFRDICVGSSAADVNLTFEKPIDYIIKGNTKYIMNGLNADKTNMELFHTGSLYVTFFYDVFKNNSVTSVNIIEYNTELSYDRLYANQSPELKESFEKQNFYVTNALRVREGLPPFSFHQGMANVALLHSQEMAENNYFNHTDLSGGTVADRAHAGGVRFKVAGENIAMGAQNTLYMHELLMNSEGHRKNILADYTALGTGVAFSKEDVPYLTQNFFR